MSPFSSALSHRNPFVLGSELMGPAICFKLLCCVSCMLCCFLMLFFQPILNIVINLVFVVY